MGNVSSHFRPPIFLWGFHQRFDGFENGGPATAVDGMFIAVVAIRNDTIVSLGHGRQGLAVFFDQVVRANPADPLSPTEGIGRFNVENYSLHLLGVRVEQFSPAEMTTVRWAFDGLFPFVLLIGLSLLTKPDELDRADRFFAKMRTPIASTPELDRSEVELSYKLPYRFDDKKLLPKSNWQFARWTLNDALGFFGCWVIVGAILWGLWIVLHIGWQA